MITWLVIVTSLLSIILILLIVGIVLYLRQIGRAVRDIEAVAKTIRHDLPPLSGEAHQVLAGAKDLVDTARDEVDRISRISRHVENLVEGRTVVDVANKAVTTSKTTIVSVIEGIKQGLKTIKTEKKKTKESSNDNIENDIDG